MSGFDIHTLDILEYGKIVSIIRGLCLTQYGSTLVERMQPTNDIDAIRTRLDEVSQMKDIIAFGEAFPLYRLEDGTELIKKSRTEGIFLEPLELLRIKDLIDVSAGLHNYSKSESDRSFGADRFPLIAEYLNDLHPFPEIKKEISKTIDRDGEILDSASSKLKHIRIDIGDMKSKISSRLEKILSSRKKSPGWQDDTVTQRDGRYVIPVVTTQFQAASGIIHDRSQSGATVYVEPNEVVEHNNRLGQLFQEERFEIDRILRRITAMIGAVASRLMSNAEIIGILDSIHAAGLLSIKINGGKPRMNEHSGFKMYDARHPLLLYYTDKKDEIVANDISLGDSRLAMIITGPNTGGKTVALKTVGLLVLMAQSGLHIPAAEKSEIGIFRNIFADIGDEQSIELSLSTFSSHIRQIIYAVRHAGADCLVLFDEIGAGTDPREGAALAEAIILKLVELKAKTIVTTHYSQLKTLPMTHPEIENASFEFNRESLEPTFRLHTGLPGASYAVEIAQRLGLPRDIAEQAAKLTGSGERSLSTLIESLEKELATLRRDKAALEEKLQSAERLEKIYFTRIEKFKNESDDTRKRQMEELENMLADTRGRVEKLVKEIKESNASKKTIRHLHKFLDEKKTQVEHLKERQVPKTAKSEKLEPGDMVWVDTVKKEGELVSFIGEHKAKVRIGNIINTVDIDKLRKVVTDKPMSAAGQPTGNLRDITTPGQEIHLIGMTVEEAVEVLDKFLDSAVLSGPRQIYVVHGKGTGALRKGVGQYLKNHPAVQSMRLGDWNEGGAGVTVVQLK
jgi:DNA mismatch repair protein MutS2